MIVKIQATEHVHYSAEIEIDEQELEDLKYHARLRGISPDDLKLDPHHITNSEIETDDTIISVSRDGGKKWDTVYG